MSKLTEALRKSEKMRAGGAAEESDINLAEEALCLSFAPEYRDYLKELGFASYIGHELTGICKSARLNVVNVTMEAREIYDIDSDMYVVEDTGYEGILILQDQKGTVYQISPHSSPKRIAESLTDYIKM